MRATRPGLVVVAGLLGQKGTHPTSFKDGVEAYAQWPGGMITLNMIIADTSPLATDIVAAKVMGFEPEEIPTFEWAWKAGMHPHSLDEIEIRGAELSSVERKFERPRAIDYNDVREWKWWCPEKE